MMSKNSSIESASSDALRLKALQSGFESRVEVNQRMLIDKMLARYSSDFVVCRELIQNSDDAKATSFHFEITCNDDLSSSCEKDFHNKTITEIRAINNGLVFNETDWKRVAAIAEGNTNVESVGQFGVGFFSVFSFSEEPIITSGNEYMAFIWRDDNSLTTYRHELPIDQQSQLTSIILKMRTKYILHTEINRDFDPTIDINQQTTTNSPNKKKQKKSLPIETMTDIIPIINLSQLKAYFTKVLSFTKYINELIIKINQKIIFKVTKTKKKIPSTKSNLQFKKNSIHNMLRLDTFIQTEQTFSIDHGPSITLNHISVDATLIIDDNYHNHIRRILKKSLPPCVQIQLLYAPNNIIMKQQVSTNNNLNMKILNSLIPLKFQNNDIYPSGLIFIGLGTHQTTGIGMHVYSHLIPTIERENLDLQDPYISKWNRELLLSVGQIARFVYDQLMNENKQFQSTLASYSFQPSVPNNEIGTILLDGFFSSNKDLLVPVKRSPSDINLSLVSSTEAYIANSKYIHSFLSLPLVPYELSQNGLFQSLKDRDLIIEVTNELIESTIITTILLSNQFVEFLHWLSSQHHNDKQYIKRLLSIVRFRETIQSPIITLEKLKNYDNFNISTILPLPSHVLPASVATYLSRDELQKQLSLTPLTLKDFLHFYLLKTQQYLFTKENTSTCLLSIISKHSGQLNKTEWNKLKTTLSTMTCIPTNQGMKIPNESYIPSSMLSSDLPVITLNVPQNLTDIDNEQEDDKQSIIDTMENPVSEEFLKRLGCRTLNVQSFVHARSSLTNSNAHNMKSLIEHLMEERDNMSEGDFNALKQSECLRGTTLIPSKEITKKYAPQDLHFPSIAIQLQWSTLPIIDWHDIDPYSREYAFLKEIGVREVPDLQKLINRIIEEHNEQKNKSIHDYKIPIALKFLAENFQQHYSKLWKTAKIKQPFLPSYSSSKTLVLSLPEEVFKDESPLCATLLPDVVQLFEEHFNIGLLGVKDRPTLTVAFDILMEKKEDILNVQSAAKIFAYMNELDGLSRPLIERISKLAFIPLQGTDDFMKPSQVFIRPDSTTSSSSSRLRQINVILPPSSSDNDDDDDEITRGNGRRRRKRNVKTTIPKNKKTKTTSSIPLIMDDDTDKSGLIDYVDYGSEGNSFLLGIGVLHQPSAIVLAGLLIDRQADYFSNLNRNNPNELKQKLLAYTSCLRQLANASNELQSATLVKRLKNEAWCLGYQTVERRSNNEKQRMFKIVSPNEIYLDDDHQCAIDLQPLLPPDESELTKLYEKFGAQWLSECVKRTLVHKGKVATSDRGNKLRDLIQYRLDMLFVNNRGEKMDNLDEKHIDMLRTNLSVYEVDGIQCQLTFQKKTITLESTDSSSCALEHDKNKVSLYFQKHIREFDYIDIASELARFVFKKPLDTIVHTISDKLASPLETLKRRGVPVDRLLQHNQQNIRSTVQMIPQENQSNHHRYQESHIEMSGHVEDFNHHQIKDDTKLYSILKKGRAYTQTKFIQQEHVKDEIDHSCEAVPSANMTRHKELFHTLPLYVERNVVITDKMLDQAKQLAWILIGLANHVFKIPIETLHLYRDINGARIAFNDRRALFFNLRYYEQVFANKVQPYLQSTSSSSIPIIHTIINFYFILTCHELAHNLEIAHNSNFINHLETIAVKFLTEKDLFLQQFSFQNYLQN
ncbi:unnamed protein product [Adineta steineri]|uniref:Sacsin/Nov domain-containing protein n=1 Tax=Adineta steineri TaxID=433720 RepID=A0A815M2G7_9BILA|nr:unnamed protein product [Adineta steineri]